MTAQTETQFSLELHRLFDAAPARVFQAWVTKDWGVWLPPAGASCLVTLLEPHVGGRYHVNMTMADRRPAEISGIYRELVPDQKLLLTWIATYIGDAIAREALMYVDFMPHGTQTFLSLRLKHLPSRELRNIYESGWSGNGGSFDKLASYLSRSAFHA